MRADARRFAHLDALAGESVAQVLLRADNAIANCMAQLEQLLLELVDAKADLDLRVQELNDQPDAVFFPLPSAILCKQSFASQRMY
jgi:hypothetical protein